MPPSTGFGTRPATRTTGSPWGSRISRRSRSTYRATNLLVQEQGQRRYTFTNPEGDADRLFEFYRAIEDARARLAEGAQPAGAAAVPSAP